MIPAFTGLDLALMGNSAFTRFTHLLPERLTDTLSLPVSPST